MQKSEPVKMKKSQKTTPLRPERGCGRTKAGRAALPKVQPTPEPAGSAGNARRDPFLLDGEELRRLCDEQQFRLGLAAFKEHRVLEVDCADDTLLATVEDDASGGPLAVRIVYANGRLSFACDCAPSDGSPVCRHQVAALQAHADRRQTDRTLLGAADIAIAERTKRGLAEVEVQPASGEPWFGSWLASSVAAATHFPQNHRVTIRSLKRRANFCSCPDFANNRLGTCKHIEAVLHRVRKHPEYEKFKDQAAPFSYVHLAWDVAEAPRLRLHRAPEVRPELAAVCDRYFDAAGFFSGRLPDDFFRFVELVEERSDLHLGEDAVDFANHLAAAAARQLRAEAIGREIRASGGQLPGVRARLYPYQVEGAAFLAGRGRALLADDMGLGKTLQAIAAAAWLRERDGLETVLVICPASLKQQWAREIERFTGLPVQLIEGPPPERGAQYRRRAAFSIVNYELVLRDLAVINDTMRPDLVILDEAQRLKNWRTKIASAVKLVGSRHAFVLTGTPLENRLEDLYSLMQVVDPGVLGPLWRYLVDFHVTDARGKVLGYRNLSVLRRRLAPVMLRRDRRLVRDQLPERIVQQLDVALTARQRDLHDEGLARAGRLARIARKRPLTPTERNRLLAALQQARMACNAAGLVDKETKGSPKLDELTALLDELCLQSGLKAVVFSQWEQMTRLVEDRLRKMGLGYVRLHGGVPTARRGALMDRFRDDDAVQVFISTDAGGVGLNLQAASVLVNLDVPWNPAVLEQRNARVHRLGQTRTVQIITMVAADSYEEQVLALVRGKQQLFDHVVGEEASEDVVGVSKKLLDTLIDNLAEPEQPADDKEAAVGEETEDQTATEPAGAAEKTAAPAATGIEAAISRVIEELQQTFGARLERIYGAGGGLVAVIDRVEPDDDRLAARLSATVAVALLDRLAVQGLARLGAASPLAAAPSYYDATPEPTGSGRSLLALRAAEKLRAARLLLDQQLTESAAELLLAALLAAAADRAGRAIPIEPREVGVWVYGEALPRGVLSQEEGTLLMRAASFAQSGAVPPELVHGLAAEVEAFVGA
ncbi:SNF2-related protein [Desulfurivibrio sp. D14AmB]|uniref:DEAD/DEAH box helicase n=1 Tax=Desulfurivibrio sp. D14AmB TaxID=3374370 RepID=UPI00376EA767